MVRVKFVCPLFLLASLAGVAHADTIHLDSGRVIEGSAKVEGDRVIIELEAGRMTLPAQTVKRIDRGPSALHEAHKREAALAPGDTAGLLRLADFCRDHELRRKERELLERIVSISPEHAEARRRLGFVRTRDGWVESAELARRDQRADLEARQAKLALEKQALEKQALELKLAEAELARKREQDQTAQRERELAAPPAQPIVYPIMYGPYTPYAPYPLRPPRVSRPLPPRAAAPFPIPGVRDPQDMSFSLPGVRDPKSYFEDDQLRR